MHVNDVKQPLDFYGASDDGMRKLEELLGQEYTRDDGFDDFTACTYEESKTRVSP